MGLLQLASVKSAGQELQNHSMLATLFVAISIGLLHRLPVPLDLRPPHRLAGGHGLRAARAGRDRDGSLQGDHRRKAARSWRSRAAHRSHRRSHRAQPNAQCGKAQLRPALGDSRVSRVKQLPSLVRRASVHQRPSVYYVSTLGSQEVPAVKFACLVRKHWAIENGLHHVLDTVLAEDTSHIRHNPGVFALNLLCSNGEGNIAQALWRNALSLDMVLNYAGVREN